MTRGGTTMKPSVRVLVASAAALTTGLIAGPLLLGGGDAAPVAYAMIDGQSAYFVAIPAYRTMDSREEEPVEKLGRTQDGELNSGLAMARFVQFELGGSADALFPDDAVAVTFNVTVTDTEGAGYVQIDGFTYATGETSTVNWSTAGLTVANGGVARLTSAFDDPGALGVYLGGDTAAKAHVVIDITGYYMPLTI